MSNKVDHQSKLDGGGNKRKRRRNNKQQADDSTYNGILFNKRSSSGRPGSPRRYFDSSFDILMEDTTSDNALEAASNEQLQSYNQVVHRHLNGLCIITAGNVIQQQLGRLSNGDNKEEDGIPQINDIKFHIQPSKDSQSARGKMRTKKKKRKKQQSLKENDTTTEEGGKAEGEGSSKREVANHDGYVTPKDTLCTVTLSNDKEIQLKCCVEGTVIEINNRLVDGSNSSDDAGTTDCSTTQGDVSLLIKEPLLDGYLAVIMPSRGVFPPRCT